MVFIIDEDSIYDYINLNTIGVLVGVVHAILPM